MAVSDWKASMRTDVHNDECIVVDQSRTKAAEGGY